MIKILCKISSFTCFNFIFHSIPSMLLCTAAKFEDHWINWLSFLNSHDIASFVLIPLLCRGTFETPVTLYRITSERRNFHAGLGCCLLVIRKVIRYVPYQESQVETTNPVRSSAPLLSNSERTIGFFTMLRDESSIMGGGGG